MRSHSTSASTVGIGVTAVIVAVLTSCSAAQSPGSRNGAAVSAADAENTHQAMEASTSTDAATYIDSLEPASLELLATKDEFLQTSAASVFTQAMVLLIGVRLSPLADQSVTAIEPQCPSIVEEDVKVSIIGGCIDEDDVHWKGRATLIDIDRAIKASSSQTQQDPDANGQPFFATVEYSNFGSLEQRTCDVERMDSGSLLTGRVELDQLASDNTRFSIELIVKQMGFDIECQPAHTQAIVYAGSMINHNPGGSPAKLGVPFTMSGTWNGSGRIGWSHLGRVEVSTTDERLHHSCASEPLSGETTLRSGNDVAVISYDGASTCDDPGAASWSLNDEYQGEITGVSCSAAPSRKVPWLTFFFAAVLFAALRRFKLCTGLE